jgi:hypothetical protein
VCFVFLCKFCKILIFWFALCVRTYAYTFERVLAAAFDLALVSSTAAPHHTLSLMHACGRTYPVSSNAEPFGTTCTRHECGRTHLCTFKRTRAEPFHDLFLGQFFPFPSFPYSGRTLLPLSSPSFPPITP